MDGAGEWPSVVTKMLWITRGSYAAVLPEPELMKPIAINVHMIQGQSINYATQIAARKIRKLLDKRSGFFNK